MKANIGSTDRWIRVIIGFGILALGVAFKSWWGLIGLIPIATATIRYCGLYSVCGMDTTSGAKSNTSHTSQTA
jgi:amino acid permease